MSAKLHIDLGQGVLDAEGEDTFVRSVYEDFKGGLLKQVVQNRLLGRHEKPPSSNEIIDLPDEKEKLSPRKSAKTSSGRKSRISDYVPKFDASLDLAKLPDFYAGFELGNHREKILIFAIFMRDELRKVPCSADDIFSCYRTLKDQTEIPEAFVQALRDTQNKAGLIEYVSPHVINITIAGENYFNQRLKKKGADK